MTSAFSSDVQVGHVSLFADIFFLTCCKCKIKKKVTFTKPFLLVPSDPTPDWPVGDKEAQMDFLYISCVLESVRSHRSMEES